MGTPCAPTVVNLLMGNFESKALARWEGTKPLLWLRYIDDVLIVIQDSEEETHKLVSHLNQQMSIIKFTSEISTQSIDFLDITFFKGPRYYATGILD